MNDRSKLPKWAQNEMDIADRTIAELQERIKQIHEPSRLSLDPYNDVPMYLPELQPVEWQIRDEGSFGTISVRMVEHPRRKTHLLVHGGTGLIAKPAASNALELYLEDR